MSDRDSMELDNDAAASLQACNEDDSNEKEKRSISNAAKRERQAKSREWKKSIVSSTDINSTLPTARER